MARIVMIVVLAALAAGCSSDAPPASTSSTGQRFPDVIDVTVSRSGAEFSFAVTVSSPYDTPERYADAFRVRSADGEVYGVNELTHDHATEQPFTRTLSGVALPAGVTEVVVEGRDQANGWGGGTRTVELTR